MGMLQARILEWVAMPSSRRSLQSMDRLFSTQGLNPDLPHCRQIIYQLSHKGSPRILEWVAYPFSNRYFWPRNREQESSALQADSLPTELSGKSNLYYKSQQKDDSCFPKSRSLGLLQFRISCNLSFIFKLEENSFTMLCWFLPSNNSNQP